MQTTACIVRMKQKRFVIVVLLLSKRIEVEWHERGKQVNNNLSYEWCDFHTCSNCKNTSLDINIALASITLCFHFPSSRRYFQLTRYAEKFQLPCDKNSSTFIAFRLRKIISFPLIPVILAKYHSSVALAPARNYYAANG